MYFSNNLNNVESKFNNYASNIKEELLNQIISKKSNCRIYFDMKYEEILYKYLSNITTSNYNTVCCKFVHDIYELVPVLDTL